MFSEYLLWVGLLPAQHYKFKTKNIKQTKKDFEPGLKELSVWWEIHTHTVANMTPVNLYFACFKPPKGPSWAQKARCLSEPSIPSLPGNCGHAKESHQRGADARGGG